MTTSSAQHRRLQEALAHVADNLTLLEQVRDEALTMYPVENLKGGWKLVSVDKEAHMQETVSADASRRLGQNAIVSGQQEEHVAAGIQEEAATATTSTTLPAPGQRAIIAIRSEVSASSVLFPTGTVWNTKPPTAHCMPAREQLFEANAGKCEFEINVDVNDIEWTLGEWRKPFYPTAIRTDWEHTGPFYRINQGSDITIARQFLPMSFCLNMHTGFSRFFALSFIHPDFFFVCHETDLGQIVEKPSSPECNCVSNVGPAAQQECR